MPVKDTRVFGGNGGDPYELYPQNSDANVKLLEVWSGWGTKDCKNQWVLKGIGLTWTDGQHKELYNRIEEDDMYQTFHFPKDPREGSASWDVRSGARVDELKFKTKKGVPWVTGGSGGKEEHLADGALVGFHGKASDDIDSLSMRYRI
ncbi:jacalin-like lectin domain protein [Metarhizium robertsii]|uniref:Mannose-binding lectin n=2 Tax=Metarhizium robertsii TaxID=568076 RepID=E9EWK7_METRA|nr:Mannose-binding lectin [Metarhizium robertsii ARSEF 23]EFZ00629.1 Mannose-binding lectin [Metarhizium robertsii ARSEF 23]EXV03140.1 jacalin-like lectin domain protein [Metarhizium robertsii]